MKKPISFSIFLALIFSASNLQGQHDGYYMPSKQPQTTDSTSSFQHRQSKLEIVVIEVNGHKIFGFVIQEIQSIWDIETPSEWYEAEKLKVDAAVAKSKLHDFGVLVASDTTLATMYDGKIEQIEIEGDTATVIFWPEKPGIQVASLPFKPISSNAWQLQVRLDNGMFFMNNDGEVTVINETGDKVTEELVIQKTIIAASTMIPF